MIPQVGGAAADPSQHQLPAAPHRAGDGAAGAGGLGGRGVRPELRPPQPRHRPQGHHARVHGVCSGVTPVAVPVLSLDHRPQTVKQNFI